LTYKIIGSAMEVHRCLGPGLLERTYSACLHHQLQVDGLRAASEVPIPVRYKDLRLDASYRADLVIEETVLVELKAAEQIMPVHCMQTLGPAP
jgi:GxxExxY protein